MDKTFNNVTILGKIVFENGFEIDGDIVKGINNVQSFERNPIMGTTSILQDELIVNNAIRSQTIVESSQVNINSIHFKDDLDNEGEPRVQTKSFSDAIKLQIENNSSQISQVIPNIINPTNNSIHASTILVDSISFANDLDENGVPKMQTQSLASDIITAIWSQGGIINSIVPEIVDPPNKKIRLSNDDDVVEMIPGQIQINNGSGAFLQGSVDTLLISAISQGGPSAQLTPGDLVIADNANTNVATCTADYVQFVAGNTQSQYSSTSTTTINDYKIDTQNHIFRLNTGISNKVYYLNQDEYIYPYMGQIGVENGNTIRLFPFSEYMGDENSEGWSCWITNLNSFDIDIVPDQGDDQSVSHSNQIQGPPFPIKKFATVRLCLLIFPNFGRVWSLSQF